MMIRTIAILTFILMTSFDLSRAESVNVLDVYSGDTLDVEIQGKPVKIKLYGIDAPKSGQDGNLSSERFLRRTVLQAPLEINIIETDIFGRALVVAGHEDQKWSINATVVANGYAWVNPTECTIDLCYDLKKMEARARTLKLGIWSGFDLVPPWEFLKKQ